MSVTTPGQRFPYGLGRRVEHDPASRRFLAVHDPEPDLAALPRKVRHRHYGPVLDQGRVGACVGFTGADALNTAGLHHTREHLRRDKDGLEFYAGATRNDQWTGNEVDISKTPPTPDEGSSGLGLAKYLKAEGIITGYTWTFSWAQFLTALAATPMCVGIGWTASMFTPDVDGLVHPKGDDEGGHELEVLAYDMHAPGGGQVELLNHWTDGWGMAGRCRMTFDDMAERLANRGDGMRLQR